MIRKFWVGGFLLGFLTLAVHGFLIEPNRVTLNQQTLQLPNWPEELRNFRIAALSDIHTGAPYIDEQKLKQIVKTVNDAHVDLVVLLGDYVIHGVVGGEFVEPEVTARELMNFRSRYGTIAVLGNHDWWYDGKRIREALASSQITVLENEAIPLRHNGQKLWILGIADFLTRQLEFEEPLKRIPEGEPIVALTHNPDLFPEIPDNISLTICGHTHGGQVLLPFLGRPMVPSIYGQKYGAGFIQEQNRNLFVTTGIGTSMVPVRFGVPPEIALLRLTPSQ